MPHMKAGCAVVNTSSINAKKPMASLPSLQRDEGGDRQFTLGLAQSLADKTIRVNEVLSGPVWAPFIPSGMSPEQVAGFSSKTPLGRPGHPSELAASYVMLASDESSYTSGTLVVVSGGTAIF